jgi:cytochrome c556
MPHLSHTRPFGGQRLRAAGTIVVGGLALAILPLLVLPVLAQTPPADPIATRQAGMKQAGKDSDEIKKVVDAGGDVTALATQAQAIADWERKVPSVFPPDSDAGKTKAKPEIWENFADFQSLAADTATQADKLVKLAQADDKAGFDAQYHTMAAACGTCHRRYRNR